MELKRKLRGVPDGARLVVDGTKALYIDGDIYEILSEFGAGTAFRRIAVECHNFSDKQLVST